MPEKRSEHVVLEAHTAYWDKTRSPRLKRIVFDNTMSQKEAVDLVKTGEGRIDLVTELSPLDTLQVAQSPFAKVVKSRRAIASVFGTFNMLKANSPWKDRRLRQAGNFAINREDLIRYATKGNGEIIPALLPVHAFGYDPALAPYPFNPVKARQLLQEAGYPNGLPISLIASEDLVIQATMERHTHEQAYFLFLYNPIKLYAVNKAVEFVPYVTTDLILAETAVTEQHWSVREAQ